MIALLEAYQAGLLNRRYWFNNILSGAIVGVVALPLAMAFAIASGVKPEQGIYTAIVAGILVSIFGGSRVQIAGPTGAFIVILASITAEYGIQGLQLATLMAGVILVVMGFTRFGRLIKYIPDPVICGFTAGIAVIIFFGQWPDFFGLPVVEGKHFHQKIVFLLKALPQLHWPTTFLACLALAILILTPKIKFLKRIPAPLVALLVITVLQSIAHFPGVQTIGTAFGGIPRGLPMPALPTLSWERVGELSGAAFTIALLGAIESLLSAVVADGMAGCKHNSNQELIGQGLANIIAPLLGGFAATGAIARTATNVRNGGSSPLAGIVHAVTLLMTLVFLAPLAQNIPLAVLAAILFVVAWNMSEWRHFLKMLKQAPRADIAILLITFFLTIFTDLVIAVNVGVVLAMIHVVRRMANALEVRPVNDADIQSELQASGLVCLPPGVIVYSIDGPFFFAAVENFEQALAATHSDPQVIIFYLRWVPFIDITGIQSLQEVIERLQQRGVRIFITGANERIKAKLNKAGLTQLIGESNLTTRFKDGICLANGVNLSEALLCPAVES